MIFLQTHTHIELYNIFQQGLILSLFLLFELEITYVLVSRNMNI